MNSGRSAGSEEQGKGSEAKGWSDEWGDEWGDGKGWWGEEWSAPLSC